MCLCSLAYAEMRLILTRVLWNFDLELQAESKNWADQKVSAPRFGDMISSVLIVF